MFTRLRYATAGDTLDIESIMRDVDRDERSSARSRGIQARMTAANDLFPCTGRRVSVMGRA